MAEETLHRLSAFTTNPGGGNPAGVWIGDALPDPATMQRIAAEVGYSETAFVAPSTGPHRTVRYFSPEAEFSFCGHATIATGVLLGEREGYGTYRLSTPAGEVPVTVRLRDGLGEASWTSVEPKQAPASDSAVAEALAALGWGRDDLDGSIPAVRAYAGNWHLVLAAARPGRLARLEYDFERLKAFMLREGLTTLQLVWREGPTVFHSRNPFPVGGVVEDPATGSAAAALGGYLRDAGLIAAPATIVIRQGEAMGRPSRLVVGIPAAGGIVVSGTAVRIDPETAAVRLRPVTEDDLATFYSQQDDPEANRMADFPARDWDAFMAHWARILPDDTGTVRTVVFEGRIAGNVVAWGSSDDRLLGYWLGREFWGKGIATRAVREFLTVEKIRPLHAHVARTNVASIRVLEKCGFERYGEEAGELVMRFPAGGASLSDDPR